MQREHRNLQLAAGVVILADVIHRVRIRAEALHPAHRIQRGIVKRPAVDHRRVVVRNMTVGAAEHVVHKAHVEPDGGEPRDDDLRRIRSRQVRRTEQLERRRSLSEESGLQRSRHRVERGAAR